MVPSFLLAGRGTLRFKCGDHYEGEFAYNMRNGFGKITYSAPVSEYKSYEGFWKDDSWHGQGKSIDKNDNVYEVCVSLFRLLAPLARTLLSILFRLALCPLSLIDLHSVLLVNAFWCTTMIFSSPCFHADQLECLRENVRMLVLEG